MSRTGVHAMLQAAASAMFDTTKAAEGADATAERSVRYRTDRSTEKQIFSSFRDATASSMDRAFMANKRKVCYITGARLGRSQRDGGSTASKVSMQSRYNGLVFYHSLFSMSAFSLSITYFIS